MLKHLLFLSCLLIVGLLTASQSDASPKKTVEFGELAKSVLVKVGSEKYNPAISYQASWDQLDNPAYYTFKKKDFAEEYQGIVRPLVIFNGKPAKEAYKKNVNANWSMAATGSRAGISKATYSASINDGADEDQIVASLKKIGIVPTALACDDNNKSLESYRTGIMLKVYKLSAKGYLPGLLVIAGDVAAQHIALDLTVIPNIKELSNACR